MNNEPMINKAESLEQAEMELSEEQLQSVKGGATALYSNSFASSLSASSLGGFSLPAISIISNKEWQE